jgi:hypothetical protein
VIHFLRRNLLIPGASFFDLPKTGPKTTPYLEKMGSNRVDKENKDVLVNCPSSTSRKKMNDTRSSIVSRPERYKYAILNKQKDV